jgi:hypothetical protein
MHPGEGTTSTFTTQELARLAAYRAAVAAGFYTDWDGSTLELDTRVLAWLRHPPDGAVGEGYPFTAQERQRLEACRAALAAGRYADDLPPPVRDARTLSAQ